MNLFKVLTLESPEITPQNTKVHLAVWNGQDHPLDVYLAGKFEEWQSWQNNKNFERQHIIALVQLSGVDRWLFVGGYYSKGCKYWPEYSSYIYQTSPISALNELSGRLVVSFKRSGRQSYLLAENWSDNMFIEELLSKKMVVEDFRGYSNSLITKATLDIIVQQGLDSWRSALANVSGIYLITDTSTGKLYVGSATGDGGIWQRWCDYSSSGHGGNKDLMALLKENGIEYAENFQYAVLEIADTHTSNDAILGREAYWKRVLCSKEFGYNAN